MVSPVVMYGCESWTIKKAEHWRIDAFELWCWRRLLRVPWTASRSNQSILKEISPEYSLEGLMLKLKFQYFRPPDGKKITWCWERLKAGKGDYRGWDGWMASPTGWILVWVNSGSWWWTWRPGVLWFMGSQIVGHDWATELKAGLPVQCWKILIQKPWVASYLITNAWRVQFLNLMLLIYPDNCYLFKEHLEGNLI